MDSYAVQFRRGSSDDHAKFVGRDGELTVDTTTWTVRVHDGVTPGGHNAARVDLGNVNLTDLREKVNSLGDTTQFVRLDSQGRLPPLDGSQLTNLPSSNFESLKAQIVQELIDQGLFGEDMPSIGSVKMGYASPGDDYIVANGAMYNRSDYPVLAASSGEKFAIESGIYNLYWPTIGYELVNQPINDVATNGSVIVAVGPAGGFWRSADDGRSWVRGSTGVSASLSAITSGKGVFVAVGAGGTIVTSVNGTTWVAATVGTAGFNTVALLNNGFVATGAGGAIAYSSDGLTWATSTISAFSAGTINTTTFAFGLYIAAGTSGLLATSPDLTTWTTRTTGHTNPITGIAVNAAGTIAVAVGGATTTANVISSPDGITWTARSTTVAQARSCVVWCSAFSAFVSGGLAGSVVTSPDGVTWTTQSGAATAFGTGTAVVGFLDRGSVALGINAGGAIIQITALATYTSKATGRGPLTKLIPGANAGSAFAIGSNVTNLAPVISKTMDSGASWYFIASGTGTNGSRSPSHDGTLNICTASTTGGVYNCRDITGRQVLTMSGVAQVNSTAYLNGKFWALGANGGLSSSVDGQTWVANFSIPATANILKIAYGNGVYVIVGGSGIAYSSLDGETWTPIVHTLGTSFAFNTLLFSNGNWVIATGSSTTVLVSTDGVNFTAKLTAIPLNILGGMVATGEFFVWTTTAILNSVNGQVWTSSLFGGTVNDVAYGNGTFVAVGGNSGTSFCATSTDGAAWIIRNVNYAGAMTSVTYASGSFLSVASPAGVSATHLQSSTNGLFWNQRTGSVGAMPSVMWTSIPNVGAFGYGVTNGGSAPHIIVPFPGPDQFRAPNIPPNSSYDGVYYVKAK